MIVHPLTTDPAYRRRRDRIAALAAGASAQPKTIVYSAVENATWTTTKRALSERWCSLAAAEIHDAEDRLDLPIDQVAQLTEVTGRLAGISNFRYRAVPGLVPVIDFFGALARGTFLSTQYVRHHGSPLYTPEPDVLHEVLGHATCLADPKLAALHRSAGSAMIRMETDQARQFIADVFWFSAEFGVVADREGPRAYGAGLLSSAGELDWFRENAAFRALDIEAMGTLTYDIDAYQPVLFEARSLNHVLDIVGGFFDGMHDDTVAHLVARSRAA
jgi:phenylalanine-4-hydroxylase